MEDLGDSPGELWMPRTRLRRDTFSQSELAKLQYQCNLVKSHHTLHILYDTLYMIISDYRKHFEISSLRKD